MKTGDNIKTDSYVHIFFLAIGLENLDFKNTDQGYTYNKKINYSNPRLNFENIP